MELGDVGSREPCEVSFPCQIDFAVLAKVIPNHKLETQKALAPSQPHKQRSRRNAATPRLNLTPHVRDEETC